MSVRSLNKVMLIGNLTRDPNMRFTPTGLAVCTFGIATNRTWTSGDSGEKQEKADFHNIVAWSKLAEVCGQYLKKGNKVYVEGRLQTREWKNKEGQDQRTTEIIIENMIILTPKGGDYQSSSDDMGGEAPATPVATSSSKKTKKQTDDTASEDFSITDDVSGVEDVSDDIPF